MTEREEIDDIGYYTQGIEMAKAGIRMDSLTGGGHHAFFRLPDEVVTHGRLELLRVDWGESDDSVVFAYFHDFRTRDDGGRVLGVVRRISVDSLGNWHDPGATHADEPSLDDYIRHTLLLASGKWVDNLLDAVTAKKARKSPEEREAERHQVVDDFLREASSGDSELEFIIGIARDADRNCATRVPTPSYMREMKKDIGKFILLKNVPGVNITPDVIE